MSTATTYCLLPTTHCPPLVKMYNGYRTLSNGFLIPLTNPQMFATCTWVYVVADVRTVCTCAPARALLHCMRFCTVCTCGTLRFLDSGPAVRSVTHPGEDHVLLSFDEATAQRSSQHHGSTGEQGETISTHPTPMHSTLHPTPSIPPHHTQAPPRHSPPPLPSLRSTSRRRI